MIQTIGRAARNVHGKVIMYADRITDSMRMAIDETNRRRAIQKAYNDKHGIEPISIIKAVYDLTARLTNIPAVAEERGDYQTGKYQSRVAQDELKRVISELENQMKLAAKDLEFERAAALRDQIYELRAILAEESNLSPLKKVRLLSGEE